MTATLIQTWNPTSDYESTWYKESMDTNISRVGVKHLISASQRHNFPSDLANPWSKTCVFSKFREQHSFKPEILHQNLIMKVHDTRSPGIPILVGLVLTAWFLHHKDIISLAIWQIPGAKLVFFLNSDSNTHSNLKSNIRVWKYMIHGVHGYQY